MIALAEGDLVHAERSFLAATEIDRNHSNAAFQMGLLAERRHDIDQARTWYHRALAASHNTSVRSLVWTRQRQLRLPLSYACSAQAHDLGAPPDEIQPDVSPGPGGPKFSTIYAKTTSRSRAKQSSSCSAGDRRATQVQRLRRPLCKPNYGRDILALAGLIALARTTEVNVPAVTSIVIALAVGLMAVAHINVSCMRIRIANGRLQIERGVLHKKVKNIDLWHIVNVGLDRTLVNRITGDGTLQLALNLDPMVDPRKKPKGTHTTVRITGLASGPDLSEMQQSLLNIAFLLRGNPVLKGIIQ